MAVKALLLSSVGVIFTAALTTVFCFFVLKIKLLESMLIGAVMSSTDAASVFSVLRSKNLNLKYNTASMLEMEAEVNHPFAYMLTVIVLSFMRVNTLVLVYSIAAQIVFGVLIGFLIALGAVWFMKHFTFIYRVLMRRLCLEWRCLRTHCRHWSAETVISVRT